MPLGVLHYGPHRVEIEDRTLAHVQLVIAAKLRRHEPFLLTWSDPARRAARYSAWIDSGVPILFRFEGSRPIAINRVWLESLMEGTHTLAGLQLTPECDAP